jgi:hypothetical protein
MNNFHVGQKVVCVDDTLRDRPFWRGQDLVKGKIYTIADVYLSFARKIPAVRLAEIDNPIFPPSGRPYGYYAHRFRPVKTTSIEQLERLLLTENQPTGYIEIWDNRRKQRAPARGH